MGSGSQRRPLQRGGDCFAFAEFQPNNRNQIEMLLAVESLWYFLSPSHDRHIQILLDAVFKKTGEEESYLVVAHPKKVKMSVVPDIAEAGPEGTDHTTLLENAYGKGTAWYAPTDKGPEILINCVHFDSLLRAFYPRFSETSEIRTELNHLQATHSAGESSKTIFTVAKIGPFKTPRTYALRIAVEISTEAIEEFELDEGLFRVEGPGVLFDQIDSMIENGEELCFSNSNLQFELLDESTRRRPQVYLENRVTQEEKVESLLFAETRRNPRRYDVLVAGGDAHLPEYSRLTADTTQIRPKTPEDQILLFSCIDRRQKFEVELEFATATEWLFQKGEKATADLLCK